MNSSNNQTIEQLTSRYNKLHETRITAGSDLKHATNELSKLKQEALENYGTDDITALEYKLNEMRQSNEQKLESYQQHLDEIETKLKAIDEDEVKLSVQI